MRYGLVSYRFKASMGCPIIIIMLAKSLVEFIHFLDQNTSKSPLLFDRVSKCQTDNSSNAAMMTIQRRKLPITWIKCMDIHCSCNGDACQMP